MLPICSIAQVSHTTQRFVLFYVAAAAGLVSYRRNRDDTVVPLASISAQPPQRCRLQPRIRSQPPLFAAFFHHEPPPLQFCFLIRRGRCLISLLFFRLTFQRFRSWDGVWVC
ncbi:hypothetical protein Hanom_Chr00s122942g01812361 [Helianthus anomalus]